MKFPFLIKCGSKKAPKSPMSRKDPTRIKNPPSQIFKPKYK